MSGLAEILIDEGFTVSGSDSRIRAYGSFSRKGLENCLRTEGGKYC